MWSHIPLRTVALQSPTIGCLLLESTLAGPQRLPAAELNYDKLGQSPDHISTAANCNLAFVHQQLTKLATCLSVTAASDSESCSDCASSIPETSANSKLGTQRADFISALPSRQRPVA